MFWRRGNWLGHQEKRQNLKEPWQKWWGLGDSVVKAFDNGNWMCAYRALFRALEFQFIEQEHILYVENDARAGESTVKMGSVRS